jgi:hypothetical protein
MAIAKLEQKDALFRADAGFIPRVDTRAGELMARRTFWGDPGAWYSFMNVGLVASRTEDLEGNLTDEMLMLTGGYSGPMQSNLDMRVARRKELFAGEVYSNLDAAYIGVEIRPSGVATLGIGSELSESIDYMNNRKGAQITAGPTADLKLGRHVDLGFRHSLKRFQHEGERTFTANLSQLRFVYNFNVRSFLRAIVQYQVVDRNPDAYLVPVDPETTTLFTQVLFSYKVNPQTVLFLGYSDNALGFVTPELARTELTRSQRTFFLKLGYAWRP